MEEYLNIGSKGMEELKAEFLIASLTIHVSFQDIQKFGNQESLLFPNC